MDRDDVERLVQLWTRAIAEGQLDVFDELLADDVLDRSGPVSSQGIESFKVLAAGVRAVFAEIELVVEDLLVDGDAIACTAAYRRRPTFSSPTTVRAGAFA